MFRLRPSRQWQSKSVGGTVAQPTTFTAQLLALLGLKRASAPPPQRRASDALGLRASQLLHGTKAVFGEGLAPQRTLQAPLLEPKAEHEMTALETGAGGLTAEMEQSERLLLGLQAQLAMGDNLHALQKHSTATFAHIDQELDRWSLRAAELERAVFQPAPSPGLFASSASASPAQRLRRWLHLPERSPSPGDNRAAGRVQQQRLSLPAPRQNPRFAQLPMRAQINWLGQKPAAPARPMAVMAAQLHERIEHVAQDLLQHRQDKGAKEVGQKDRRLKNRPAAGLPPPMLRPKARQDEKA